MLYETVVTTTSPGAKRERAKNRVREIRFQMTLQFLNAFEFPFAMKAHISFLIVGHFSMDGRDYIRRNVEGAGVSLHRESLRWS